MKRESIGRLKLNLDDSKDREVDFESRVVNDYASVINRGTKHLLYYSYEENDLYFLMTHSSMAFCGYFHDNVSFLLFTEKYFGPDIKSYNACEKSATYVHDNLDVVQCFVTVEVL